VLTGLNAGQTYIAEGAFVIKSELLKESFGGGHGH
jgi:cobalt-zinc-cadmium efflux system membrane fusion protein